LEYRSLGKSGIRVSYLGIGGSAFGGGVFHRDDRAVLALLHEGINRGVNFIDTSDNYGMGRSEILIGRVLRDRRSDIVIATKGGARFTPGPPAFPLGSRAGAPVVELAAGQAQAVRIQRRPFAGGDRSQPAAAGHRLR
jgi:aryl-alcohol dehydrogenase-like predicted oxidoreductase